LVAACKAMAPWLWMQNKQGHGQLAGSDQKAPLRRGAVALWATEGFPHAMADMENGLVIIGVSSTWTNFVIGVVFLVVILFNYKRNKSGFLPR